METQNLGNRIIILGCPGSGKSTLAGELHRRSGLPLYHLDRLWWNADRTHISREEFDSRLQTMLQGEKWIIDGDYSRTYEPRFAACDTVIFLDYDTEACMAGIMARVGQDRPDMPWTERRLDPGLVALVRSYRAENRPKVYSLIEKYPGRRLLVFQSRAETDAWLAGLPQGSERAAR